MRRNGISLAILFLLWLLSACTSQPAVSEKPPTGKWAGDYSPGGDRREAIDVELRWEETNLRGIVHAGARTMPITKASFTPETGAITLEFDAQGNGGQTVHYSIEGKVDGNSMTGNWTHDAQRGDFKVTKQ